MLSRIAARSRATSSRTNSGEIAVAASVGVVSVKGDDCGAASRAGPASSRVLVAGSNVSTPANEAAAITALMNFNMRHPFVSHTNWFQYSVAAPNTVLRQISTCGHFARSQCVVASGGEPFARLAAALFADGCELIFDRTTASSRRQSRVSAG